MAGIKNLCRIGKRESGQGMPQSGVGGVIFVFKTPPSLFFGGYGNIDCSINYLQNYKSFKANCLCCNPTPNSLNNQRKKIFILEDF